MTYTDTQIEALHKRAITVEDAQRFGIIPAHFAADLPVGCPDYWSTMLPALVFPWHSPSGETQYQLRPDNPPKDENDRPKKYVFPTGSKPILNRLVHDPANTVDLIVEGTCQSVATALHAPAGVNVWGIAGCYSWTADGLPSTDLSALTGDVFVALDADAATNLMVYTAGDRLGQLMRAYGQTVRFVHVPGTATSGLDDVLSTVPADRRPAFIANLITDARERKGQSADKPASQKPKGTSEQATSDAATLVRAVTDRYTLAKDERGEVIGRAKEGTNRVALDLDQVVQRCAAESYDDGDEIMGTHAARETVFHLGGKTGYQKITTQLRSYHDADNHRLVIDIGDDTGDVITVTGDGWWTGPNTDEHLWFRRPSKQQPLPRPERGGSLDDLRGMFPVNDDQWTLLLGWLVAAPFTTYERPWLYVWGPRGSGKTGTAVSALNVWDPPVDGDKLDTLDAGDLHVSAYRAMVPAFDNASELSAKTSDLVASLTTGSATSRRTLYTTSGETTLAMLRTGVITGIDVKGIRPDLQERLLSLELTRNHRLVSKSDIRRKRERDGGSHLGAVLDEVARVLRKLRDGYRAPELAGYSRFADFLRVVAAHSENAAREFVLTSEQDREATTMENPVVGALVEYVKSLPDQDTGEITTNELLTRFRKWAEAGSDAEVKFRNPRSFGGFVSTNFGEPVGGVKRETWRSKTERGVRLWVADEVTGDKGDKLEGGFKSPEKNSLDTDGVAEKRVFLGGLETPVSNVTLVTPELPHDPGCVKPDCWGLVDTGLAADGSVLPTFGIKEGREYGTEKVRYCTYKARMIAGNKWVEPVPGWTFEAA